MYNDEFKNKKVSVLINNNINESALPDEFEEIRGNEQYFFTKNVIEKLTDCLFKLYFNKKGIETNVCLICAPSFAYYLYKKYNINVTCLDIDKRFENLPGFIYFDIKNPFKIINKKFDIIIIDPPFFALTLKELNNGISYAADFNYNTKLIFTFMKRNEKEIIKEFFNFGLKLTNFQLEYATVSESKWNNYGLFCNVDIPYIKRIVYKKSKLKNFKLKNLIK